MSTKARTYRLITCVEHSPVDVRIADLLDESGALFVDNEARDRGYFSVSLQRQGQLTLHAGHHVGLIPLNDEVALQVTPRVPISSLSRVATIAGAEPAVLSIVRSYGESAQQDTAVRDLLAEGYIAALEPIARFGRFRTYKRQFEVGSMPRGSLDFAATLRERSRNAPHRAGFHWFERTPDEALNRCLRHALTAIASQFANDSTLSEHGRSLLQRLNALHPLFDGVSTDRSQEFLADPMVRGQTPLPSTRSYYRAALDIALSIIRRAGIVLERDDGPLPLPSIVFDMSVVFERFIRNVLEKAGEEEGWPVSVQDGNAVGSKTLFGKSDRIALVTGSTSTSASEATPDIVFRNGDGSVPLIGEVKYIPLGNRAYDRDAVNQSVTYAVSYSTNRAVIVHPWNGGQRGLSSPGVVGDVEVWIYQFDLGAADLDAETAAFTSVVRSLLPE